jgi:hypothetical protein
MAARYGLTIADVRTRFRALNRFDVFHERHAKEILDLPRRKKAESLIQLDCSFKGRGRVEAGSLAMSFQEVRLRLYE